MMGIYQLINMGLSLFPFKKVLSYDFGSLSFIFEVGFGISKVGFSIVHDIIDHKKKVFMDGVNVNVVCLLGN